MIPIQLECESYLIQLYINNTSTIPDQTYFSELNENDLRLFWTKGNREEWIEIWSRPIIKWPKRLFVFNLWRLFMRQSHDNLTLLVKRLYAYNKTGKERDYSEESLIFYYRIAKPNSNHCPNWWIKLYLIRLSISLSQNHCFLRKWLINWINHRGILWCTLPLWLIASIVYLQPWLHIIIYHCILIQFHYP